MERLPPTLNHLPDAAATALREALAYIRANFAPAGVVVSGSIVRGDGDPESDLDLVVLHTAPFRQRLQRRWAGVPVEMFVNNSTSTRRSFGEDAARGRPSMPHMLATGVAIGPVDPALTDLIDEARALLAAGPLPDPERLTRLRYAAVTELEDARDLAPRDPDMAALLLTHAVDSALELPFWSAGLWQPRAKERLTALAALDSALADTARRFFRASLPEERRRLATLILRRTAGEVGFFEWSSSEDPTG